MPDCVIPTFPPRFRKDGGNGGTGGNVNFILQVTDIKVFRQLPYNILPATKRHSASCRANFRRSSQQISSANRFFASSANGSNFYEAMNFLAGYVGKSLSDTIH